MSIASIAAVYDAHSRSLAMALVVLRSTGRALYINSYLYTRN
jgi:hypothetical protein